MAARSTFLARVSVLTCVALATQLGVRRECACGEEIGPSTPAPESLIAQLQGRVEDSLVDSIREWTSWPSQADIDKYRARRDRSKEIPAIYPPGKGPGWKPIRPGARLPTAAVWQSAAWVHRILLDKWTPKEEDAWHRTTLQSAMVPLQLDPASKSTVICQYELKGSRWQVAQTVAALCLVVKPAPEMTAGVRPEDLGPFVFREFLKDGDKLAERATKRVAVEPLGLVAFVPENVALTPFMPHPHWFEWRMWYTDGKALALFIDKSSAGGVRPPDKDDPWF